MTGGFSSQRPVMQSFDVFFDLCRNKRLGKQSRCWWFDMPSHSVLCHCNVKGWELSSPLIHVLIVIFSWNKYNFKLFRCEIYKSNHFFASDIKYILKNTSPTFCLIHNKSNELICLCFCFRLTLQMLDSRWTIVNTNIFTWNKIIP